MRAGVTLDLAHHDTTIAADYSHGFDSVCDLEQPGVPGHAAPAARHLARLLRRRRRLTEESLGIDTVEASLTQTLSTRAASARSAAPISTSTAFSRTRIAACASSAASCRRRSRIRGCAIAAPSTARAALRGRAAGGHARRRRAALSRQLGRPVDHRRAQLGAAASTWQAGLALSWRARAATCSRARSFYRDVGYGRLLRARRSRRQLLHRRPGAGAARRSAARRALRARRASYTPDSGAGACSPTSSGASAFDYVKIFALSPEPPNAARTRGFASALVLALVGDRTLLRRLSSVAAAAAASRRRSRRPSASRDSSMCCSARAAGVGSKLMPGCARSSRSHGLTVAAATGGAGEDEKDKSELHGHDEYDRRAPAAHAPCRSARCDRHTDRAGSCRGVASSAADIDQMPSAMKKSEAVGAGRQPEAIVGVRDQLVAREPARQERPGRRRARC